MAHHDTHDDHSHAGHSHGGHSHAPADFGRAFAVGVALNTSFVLVEAVFGFLSGSLALLADAGHNLSDVLGLLIAWGAAILSRRPPTPRHTYGLRRSSILAALLNALFLLVAVGGIAWEAVGRLSHPEPVAGETVIVVAAIGVVINTATAMLFMAGRKGDLNIRGAFLHMAADAGVSLGVVLAGVAILVTGRTWIDPMMSLVVVAVIVWSTWGLLRDSVNLALDAVPAGVDPVQVKNYLESLPGVIEVHDLHIWPMSTTETALTAHLVMREGKDAPLARATEGLRRQFHIEHTTLQVEGGDCAGPCHLAHLPKVCLP